jgi:hypothetical protein
MGINNSYASPSSSDVQKIADHSFKHSSEFGVTDRNKWLNKINETIRNPSKQKISGNKEIYWYNSTKMIVIYNPGADEKGTAFKTTLDYYNSQ